MPLGAIEIGLSKLRVLMQLGFQSIKLSKDKEPSPILTTSMVNSQLHIVYPLNDFFLCLTLLFNYTFRNCTVTE